MNLVIGTLYCAKGNYEFGVSRVIKSLQPYDRKLGTDTWYYAKRCLLSLGEGVAKHIVTLPDVTYADIIAFLDNADRHGKGILTVMAQDFGACLLGIKHRSRQYRLSLCFAYYLTQTNLSLAKSSYLQPSGRARRRRRQTWRPRLTCQPRRAC